MAGACLCCSPIRQTKKPRSPGALVRVLHAEMTTILITREEVKTMQLLKQVQSTMLYPDPDIGGGLKSNIYRITGSWALLCLKTDNFICL